MEMADVDMVEDFYISHSGWCSLKIFLEDWRKSLNPFKKVQILISCIEKKA